MAGITQNGQKSLTFIVVLNQRIQLKILSYKDNNNSDKRNNSGNDKDNISDKDNSSMKVTKA